MYDFEALQQALPIEGRTVADIGCGDGAIVRRLRDAGADAVGVDIDVTPPKRATPTAATSQGGAQELPLEDQSVDVAIMFKSLHHVPDPHAAFPELHRVVRGEVFIAEPLPRATSSSCSGRSTTRPTSAPPPRRRSRRRRASNAPAPSTTTSSSRSTASTR